MNVFLVLGFTCALLFCNSVSTQECPCVHGFCERPGECRCGAGWRGVACDRCVPLAEPGQCVCERGWTGARCDIRLCSSKPCFGNSSCLNVGDDFICICAAGFTGKHCQLKNTPCLPDGSSCQNGGTCGDSSGSDKSSCICPSGFTGRFCEINVCDPNPCENDGICTRGNLTFTCICPSAFSGPVCSSRLCSSVQCINGGTCFNHTDSLIRCVCPPGFTGSSCELHINKLKVKVKFKAAVPGHTFHKSHRPADRELLKITMKETVGASGSLATQSQVVCLTILGLLTCLVVLVTTGIIFFNRCETWMANVKYSQLVRRRRDVLLRAGDGEDHTINIIIPEKIELSNYGQGYTSI